MTDGINGWTYVYDAENRITTAGSVTYTYDADGRRVKKSSGTNYWYGPTGGVLAETDSGGNWTNYIFFGGQRLARNVSGDIKYYVTDHLHSTAMFVDKSGSVLDDNDFYPWGGVVPGVGQTTSNNTVKFTGQYRDTESNLDYFGARYYANVTGRFMSPDWDGKPVTVPYAAFGDPQSLNLYSFARNMPITRIENGHGINSLDNIGFDSFDDADGGSNVESSHTQLDHTLTSREKNDLGLAYIAQNGFLTPDDQAGTGGASAYNGPVSAEANGTTVTYTYADGTKKDVTGNHPQRDNNPGDITADPNNFENSFARGAGAIGLDGRFAIFVSADAGFTALDALLMTPRYQKLTIDQAINIFAPPTENNTAGYQASVRGQVGVSGGTRVSSLTSGQLDKLEQAIAHVEGFYTGKTTVVIELPRYPDRILR